MITGITPGTRYNYILKAEKNLPKEEQTIFQMKSLTGEEMIEVLDLTAAGTHKAFLVSIQLAIVGWENFKDDKGNDIPYKLENVARIPWECWAKMSADILADNQVSAELKKKSKSAPKSKTSKT